MSDDLGEWPFLVVLRDWITAHPQGPTGWVPRWHRRRVATRCLQRDLHGRFDAWPHNEVGVSASGGDRQRVRVPESGNAQT